MSLQTEFTFTLPRGYLDGSGQVHRMGVMRLATALDEIESMEDARVQSNDAYLPVVLLSRVVVRLGEFSDAQVTPQVIERLFAADMAYLEDLYMRLNSQDSVVLGVVCPHCSQRFDIQVAPLEQ
jgi:hypothetical protein